MIDHVPPSVRLVPGPPGVVNDPPLAMVVDPDPDIEPPTHVTPPPDATVNANEPPKFPPIHTADDGPVTVIDPAPVIVGTPPVETLANDNATPESTANIVGDGVSGAGIRARANPR